MPDYENMILARQEMMELFEDDPGIQFLLDISKDDKILKVFKDGNIFR